MFGLDGEERQLDVIVVVGGQQARGYRLGAGRARRGVQAGEWVGVLGAFAGAQPSAADAEQVGNFVQAGEGYATFEPVVDVLRGHLALCGKVGRGQVALVQERFETITRCIHGARV